MVAQEATASDDKDFAQYYRSRSVRRHTLNAEVCEGALGYDPQDQENVVELS